MIIDLNSTTLASDGAEAVYSSERQDSRLHLTALYTTLEGTLPALRTAGVLAKELKARIDVLTIQVVPHPLPFDRPQVPVWFYERLMDALASQVGLDDVTTRVCLCRDQKQCLRQLLAPRSLVVLGGKRGWFSKEQRIEQWLASLGHQVVFVDLNHVPKLQQRLQMQTFLEMNRTV